MKQNPSFTQDDARIAFDVLMRIAEDCSDRQSDIASGGEHGRIDDYIVLGKIGRQMEDTAYLIYDSIVMPGGVPENGRPI